MNIIIQGHEIAGRMPPFKPHLRPKVRAGVKVETRRVMKSQPPKGWEYIGQDTVTHYQWQGYSEFYKSMSTWTIRTPYGRPNDIRVMREPLYKGEDGCAYYRDDDTAVLVNNLQMTWRWKVKTLSAMYMPTEAGRFLVRYTDIHPERLDDISAISAIREGIDKANHPITKMTIEALGNSSSTGRAAIEDFIQLWDSINAKRGYPSSTNWWLWVIAWEPVEL